MFTNGYNLFTGIVFRGSEYLPGDIIPTLENIRNWAIKNKLIDEEGFQFITPERVDNLRKYFSCENELQILIDINRDDYGNFNYLEYPFIPIKTLIKKSIDISIIYWQMIPTIWNLNGSVEGYGEVHIGLWYPNINEEEFCSLSTAKLVVKKFYEFYHKLSDKYIKKTLNNNVLEIQTDGELKARFFKTGRLYDVEFKENVKQGKIL